jgi:hypothetical protein
MLRPSYRIDAIPLVGGGAPVHEFVQEGEGVSRRKLQFRRVDALLDLLLAEPAPVALGFRELAAAFLSALGLAAVQLVVQFAHE